MERNTMLFEDFDKIMEECGLRPISEAVYIAEAEIALQYGIKTKEE